MAKWLKSVYLLVSLLLVYTSLAVCSPVKETFANTKITARTEIWKAITMGAMGSATVAVMDGGKLVYAEGFGMADREHSIPVDKDTMFNIGSISKVYVATAIMLLADEGKVALDKPLTTYLPEFTMADERYKDITVRMLLNHSSGLPGTTAWNNFGYEFNHDVYPDLLAALAKSSLKHRPGEMAFYCNDGFTLAEMIVARVSGKSYDDFLAERIFRPLGLGHTGLGVGLPQPEKGIVLARYYRPDGKREPLEVVSLRSSGGLSAPAEDLCKFVDSFSVGGTALLSERSLREMLKEQPCEFQGKLRAPGPPFGLGWDFADIAPFPEKNIRIFGKSGGTTQYASMLYTVPSQRISVAVIATYPRSNAMPIAYAILTSYLAGKGLIAKTVEKPVSLPVKVQPIPDDLMAYEGYYCTSNDALRIALDSEKGNLTEYRIDGMNESALFSAVYHDGYFYDGDTRYYFAAEAGTVYLVQRSAKGDMIIGEKLQPPVHPLQLAIPMDGKMWLRRNVKAFEGTAISAHVIVSQNSVWPGYVDFNGPKIVKSPVYAGMPIKTARDLTELRLFKKEGVTWAWLSGAVYMPAELAMPLTAGVNTLTIGREGYNEWLKAGVDSILQFEAPAKGRVIIFFPDGGLYDNMVDSGAISVPAGSLIEVAGNPGDLFKVMAAAID